MSENNLIDEAVPCCETVDRNLEQMKEYACVMIYLYHCAVRGTVDKEYMRKCLYKMSAVLDETQLKFLIEHLSEKYKELYETKA